VPKGTKRVRNTSGVPATGKSRNGGVMNIGHALNGSVYHGEFEDVEDWECDASCPIAQLDQQAGVRTTHANHAKGSTIISSSDKRFTSTTYGSGRSTSANLYDTESGGPSRYFPNFSPDEELGALWRYVSKASRRERNAGCDGLPEGMALRYGEKGQGPLPQQTPHVARPERNHHPTVKPLALCRWLARLICPPGGTVLDCFAGSGSTLVAAAQEGFHFIGIEAEEDYVASARARIAHALEGMR
jgi:site-specific DNA-methyltransferase (adenine-specific)